MLKKKLLITDKNFSLGKKKILSILGHNIDVDIYSLKNKIVPIKEIKLLKKYNLLIVGTEKYDYKVLSQLPNLKAISRIGTGIDSIDVSEAKRKNIKVLRTLASHVYPCAEAGISALLSILKNSHINNVNLKNKKWMKIKSKTLFKSNIGFVGYGKVANKIEKLLHNFNINSYYYDPFVKKKFYKKKTLKYLFNNCNFIFITCDSNKTSYHLINKNILKTVKKDIVVLNLARGNIVKSVDIINFLNKNENSFYYSDVFEEEPYFGKLLMLKNFFGSPHVLSYCDKFRELTEIESIKNIEKYLQ